MTESLPRAPTLPATPIQDNSLQDDAKLFVLSYQPAEKVGGVSRSSTR